MRKIHLDPDALEVESFVTASARAAGGTVRGHDCSEPVPQDPFPRDDGGGGGSGNTCASTCWNTCAASCNGTCHLSCNATCAADYTCNVAQNTCYAPNPR